MIRAPVFRESRRGMESKLKLVGIYFVPQIRKYVVTQNYVVFVIAYQTKGTTSGAFIETRQGSASHVSVLFCPLNCRGDIIVINRPWLDV